MLCVVLFSACTIDVIVEPTPIEINLAIEPSIIDGCWTGTLRDDVAQTWVAAWVIGSDGNKRILTGDILVIDHTFTPDFIQSFPIQHTDDTGVVIHNDFSWKASIFLTGVWNIEGTYLPETDEMIIRAAHWIEELTYTLHRSTTWPCRVQTNTTSQ